MKQLAHVMLYVLGVAAFTIPYSTHSQAYPVKPIRIVVPYEPGGAVDLTTRAVAPKMSDELGQPVIIENRGGAGGQIGAQQVARSAPDGYTIMFTVGGTHVLSLFTSKNLPYHPVKDFTPITAAVASVLCIAANASFPPNSVKELIAYAKQNPGKVSYGTTGIGSDTHLAMEQIRLLTGVQMVHVPYKGGGPLTIALVGGQIQTGALPLAPVMQQVRAGKVKVLAVFLPKRYPLMPEVSTVVEAVAGYENPINWIGVFGPAGLSRPVLGRLHAAIARALDVPEVRSQFETRAQFAVGNTPEEFAAQITRSVETAGKLVKAVGIQPE